MTTSTIADSVLGRLGSADLYGSAVASCAVLDGPLPPSVSGWNETVSASAACHASTTVPDLRLGPLADNGGLTRTRLPLAGSPLVDHIPVGTSGLCDSSNPTDQRGAPRPLGAGCDAGSVEGTN